MRSTSRKSPTAIVYAQIEKDLQEAIVVLETEYTASDVGRATKGAAGGFSQKLFSINRNGLML